MKTVKLWDKESKINGGILNLEGWMTESDVILFEENGVVTNIENPAILKNILSWQSLSKITFLVVPKNTLLYAPLSKWLFLQFSSEASTPLLSNVYK